MRKRLTPGVTRKITLDRQVDVELQRLLASSSQTLSGFVQDAVVQRIARYEAPSDFIQRKRRSRGGAVPTLFNAERCEPCGWPKRLPADFWAFGAPADEVENLRRMLAWSEEKTRELVAQAWQAGGLGDYTDAHWQETLRVLSAGKGKAASRQPAAIDSEMDEFERQFATKLAEETP